jgi:hypothetical protein
MLLSSWDPNGAFQRMNIGGCEYGTIICCMYIKIAGSDFLTLISCRTQDKFFFTSKPHPVLAGILFLFLSLIFTSLYCVVGAAIAIFASVMISVFWPCGTLDDVPVCGMSYHEPKLLAIWVLIYIIVVFLIQDILKVSDSLS